MKLKYLKIKCLKIVKKMEKSICYNCKFSIYAKENYKCRQYPFNNKDYVKGIFNIDFGLCKKHNVGGNCSYFENRFNDEG